MRRGIERAVSDPLMPRAAVRSKLPDDVDAVKVKCVALIRLEKVRTVLPLHYFLPSDPHAACSMSPL